MKKYVCEECGESVIQGVPLKGGTCLACRKARQKEYELNYADRKAAERPYFPNLAPLPTWLEPRP